MDDSQASAAESQAPPPPSSPPIQEEDSGDDDNLQSKVQKLMEKITSSPDNPNPSVLHALSSILETQESRYPSPPISSFSLSPTYLLTTSVPCFGYFIWVVLGFHGATGNTLSNILFFFSFSLFTFQLDPIGVPVV